TLFRSRVLVKMLPELAHRRQARKAVAKTLHATALLVDGNEHLRAHRTDRFYQRRDLLTAFKVARKKDQATGTRTGQQFTVFGSEFSTAHVDDQQRLSVHGFPFS